MWRWTGSCSGKNNYANLKKFKPVCDGERF